MQCSKGCLAGASQNLDAYLTISRSSPGFGFLAPPLEVCCQRRLSSCWPCAPKLRPTARLSLKFQRVPKVLSGEFSGLSSSPA